MRKVIGTKELKKLKSSFVIVEALPKAYFDQGHIEGALNIPLDSTDEQIKLLIPDWETEIVTYCTGPTCPNSTRLAIRLKELGYESITVYEEGKVGWLDAGESLMT